MKHSSGFLMSGLIVAAIGLGSVGILHPGIRAAATTEERPLADGRPALSKGASAQSQAGTSAGSGVPYSETYGSYEFKPAQSELGFAPHGSAMYATNIPAAGDAFKAPLHLPNGAQVTQVRFYVVDDSSTDNMTLQFYRTQPSVNTSQYEIAYVTTAGLPMSAAVQTVTIYGAPTLTIIDNLNYAYHLRYAPVITGTQHMIVGARVDFSLPGAFLPLITK